MIIHKKVNNFILFFLGTFCLLNLGANAQAKTRVTKDKIIEKLFKISELNTHYKEVESFLDYHKNIDPESLKPSQVGFAKNLMRQQKGPNLVRQNLKKNFLDDFDQGHIEAAIAWFKSEPGQKILKAIIKGNSSDKKREREKFIKEILILPSNESRLSIIKKIVSAESLAKNIQSLFLVYVQSMFPFNDNLQGKDLVKVLKKEKAGHILEQVRLKRLFDFKELKQNDLRAYAHFLESDAGRWFTFSELKGFKKGTQKTLAQVHKIQSKLLIEIEKGGPGFPLMRAIAPAGQRYLLVRLRDPFKPLYTDKGPVVRTREPKTVTLVRKFGAELGNIPPISIYLINKIENKQPELFGKLKYYERLFNNREDLKAMNDDEYADSIKEYRTVLKEASETKVLKTPLQDEYEKLRLTGTILKNKKNLALVETSNQKGYVVNEGDILGPMFGFVEKVQSDKIIIIEKSRNYLGNISTEQRILEFAKNI